MRTTLISGLCLTNRRPINPDRSSPETRQLDLCLPVQRDAAGCRQLHAGHRDAGLLTYGWNNITVPPNGTVAFMHFSSQESSQAAAQAATRRLVQLPPEALAGLSSDEIAEIQNFAVPAGAVSGLPAFVLNGNVSGQVLAGDGTTPETRASVTLTSNNLIYSLPHSVLVDTAGHFSFAATLNTFGSSLIIPVGPFNLYATHFVTGIKAPTVTGTFSSGQLSTTQNVVFTGTGLVSGTVRFYDGTPVNFGGVAASGTGIQNLGSGYGAGPNGVYLATGLPPVNVTLTATTSLIDNTQLSGSANVNVVAGQAAPLDIFLAPTGEITALSAPRMESPFQTFE